MTAPDPSSVFPNVDPSTLFGVANTMVHGSGGSGVVYGTSSNAGSSFNAAALISSAGGVGVGRTR